MAGELAVQTSPAAWWLDTLCERLRQRPELQGVNVWSAPMSLADAGNEAIGFGEISETQESGALGRMRREHTWTATAMILVRRPGKGETVAKETRERAYAIAAEIERDLRETAKGTAVADPEGRRTCKMAEVRSVDLDQFFDGGNRLATLEVQIYAEGTTLLVGI